MDPSPKQSTTKRKRGRPATGQTPKRSFRMSDEEFAEVKDAAAYLGVNTSLWMRNTLYRAARDTGWGTDIDFGWRE